MSEFLDSLSWYLMRRRLVAEADDKWRGHPSVRLDPAALQPVIAVLLQLALPSMYHKSGSLRASSLEALSNAVYVEPDLVLPVIVQRFHEALEASDSVHQISAAIRTLSCALCSLLCCAACCAVRCVAYCALLCTSSPGTARAYSGLLQTSTALGQAISTARTVRTALEPALERLQSGLLWRGRTGRVALV
jgi:Proteasome-substrate-size regulator, mid region